jgi:hypothetical protein
MRANCLRTRLLLFVCTHRRHIGNTDVSVRIGRNMFSITCRREGPNWTVRHRETRAECRPFPKSKRNSWRPPGW